MRLEKKKETTDQASWRVLSTSTMEVHTPSEDHLIIYLDGPAAEIPAIKNAKIPGTSFTEPSRLGRVLALDALWRVSSSKIQKPYFADKPVLLTVFFGKRKNAYDSDNALTTLRDWIEPHTKTVSGRQRGWGIGLVKSDKNVVSFALKANEIKSESKTTIISLRPFEGVVAQETLKFVNTISEGRIFA